MNESHIHYVEWKKSDWKEYILYDSIYTMLKDLQNSSMLIKEKSVCLGGNSTEWEGVRGSLIGAEMFSGLTRVTAVTWL